MKSQDIFIPCVVFNCLGELMALLSDLSPCKMRISIINSIKFIRISDCSIKVLCRLSKLPLQKENLTSIQMSQVLLLNAVEPALFVLLNIISVWLFSLFIHAQQLLGSGVYIQGKNLDVGLWVKDCVQWVFKLSFNIQFNRFLDILITRQSKFINKRFVGGSRVKIRLNSL